MRRGLWVLRGKVGDVVREGKSKSGGEEDEEEAAGSESDSDAVAEETSAGQPPENQGGNIRTSAIEPTPSGDIGFTRRSTPPPPSTTTTTTTSSILPFIERKSKSKKSKKMTLTMYPRDLLSLDLNPLSGSDVKYLEGVVGQYASRVVVSPSSLSSSSGTEAKAPATATSAEQQREPNTGSSGETATATATQEVRVKLVVKRGWKDLFGVVFGL